MYVLGCPQGRDWISCGLVASQIADRVKEYVSNFYKDEGSKRRDGGRSKYRTGPGLTVKDEL